MYQFTTTTIINSNVDTSGKTKIVATADSFSVLRTGKYLTSKIVSAYKRPYVAGVKEVAKVTVPSTGLSAGDIIRLSIEIRLEGSVESDYASPFYYFNKLQNLEILYVDTAANAALKLKSELLGLKDKYGSSYLDVTTNGAELIVTAKNVNQRFKTLTLYKGYDTSTNTMIQPTYTSIATVVVTTAGKVGFGDYKYMISNISIQTLDKGRLFSTLTDEKPELSGQYTQYTLKYKIEKDTEIGISSGMNSVTEHVFYVNSGQVSAFETALGTAGISFKLVLAAGDASLANDATTQLSATGAIGSVTYAVTSGTSATVTSAGVVTASAATDGDTVITGTDAVGNTATITITVA